MNVRRAGLRVAGEKREVVRRAGRNNALPERMDMMGEVWIGSSGLASTD